MNSLKEVIDKIKAHPQKKVKLGVTDIDGILRGKYIHPDKFASIADSDFGFCNVIFGWDSNDVCYDNVKYTGWHTGYPDASAKIDPDTYREIPWDDGVPFFLADFIKSSGEPLSVCPRQLLKKQIEKAKKIGYEAKVGLEFEWFNFRETPQSLSEKSYQNMEPITPGMFGYSILRAGQNREYFKALIDELREFDVPLEGIHTETGPGVFEAAVMASEPLQAADRGILFKAGVKDIAYRFGILPSFMAKWDATLPGCGGHIHQSLTDISNKENVFFEDSEPNQMSETFKHYLAGQMHCLPYLLPFFLPNINSYKRLVEGLWAPTKVTWGLDNRTTAFRVISGSKKSTRLETRIGGADFNPYLAVSASLASGLYGIQKKIKLEADPIQGNAYSAADALELPRNLKEASQKMMDSDIAKEILGAEFVEHFGNTRIWECRQFEQAVTNWEVKRYFELA